MNTKLLLPLVPLALSVSIADAQLVFEDNFNSNTPGTSLASTSNWEESAGNNSVRFANNVTDSGDLFGLGASNIMAQVGMSNPGGGHSVSTATNWELTEGQVLFSFYESNDSNNDAFAFFFRDNGKALQSLSLDDGTMTAISGATTSYSLDAVNTVRIVFNLSGSAQVYDGFTNIADRTFDVYLNNSLVFGAQSIVGGATAHIDDIGWDKAANTTSLVNFDDFVVSSDLTVVPEPSSFGLLAGAMALGWVMVRRRS